jgi:hypothetical protein
LVEFAPKFAVDFINLIEQNRRNSGLFRGFLRIKIDERYGEVEMQKCQIIFDRALRLKLFRLKAEGGQKSPIAVLWRKYLPAIASSGEAGGSDSCIKHGF